MAAPFTFGRIAVREDFVDREQERARLVSNFAAGVNTSIISPRRWGKSSLVAMAAQDAVASTSTLKVCQIDVFGARSEAEFYAQLASGVMRATASRWQEWAELARRFLGALRPRVSFAPDPMQEVSLEFDWEEARRNPGEVLDLAERLAEAKGIRLVVAIDEFQSVADFPDSLAFQRLLRSHWQRHQHVTYCLYGSKRHMLTDIFGNPSMPFYRFGDILLLGKIDNEIWAEFIVRRFAETGKQISVADARDLASRVDNHSYYVQQLAQQVWFRAAPTADVAMVDDAFDSLRDQLSLQFVGLAESLTARQVRLLQAVVAGEAELSAQATLKRYDLGTSANVTRMKEALANREVIDFAGPSVQILDPMFAYWLRTELPGRL